MQNSTNEEVMTRHAGVLRRRHRCASLMPSYDDTGLWPQFTWLWWTWDFIPGVSMPAIGRLIDAARHGTREPLMVRRDALGRFR